MDKDINKQIGARIKAMRLLKGLTQSELARQLGISSQQVQKYENGKNAISATRLVALGRCLGCDIGYFFGDAAGEIPGLVDMRKIKKHVAALQDLV